MVQRVLQGTFQDAEDTVEADVTRDLFQARLHCTLAVTRPNGLHLARDHCARSASRGPCRMPLATADLAEARRSDKMQTALDRSCGLPKTIASTWKRCALHVPDICC